MDGSRKKRSDAGLPQTAFQTHAFRDFGTMNTQAARQALASNEFSWLENVMPLGHGNAIIVPGPSIPMASGWLGTAYLMLGFNRGGANYMFIATTTGDLYEVLLDFAGYTVSAAFITNPGLGYSRACNLAFAGSATSAAVVRVNVTLIKAVPQLAGIPGLPTGSGYVAGDICTVSGGTFLRAATVQVTSVNGGGAPLTYQVLDGGDYSVVPPLGLLAGGTGTGAQIVIYPIAGGSVGGFGLGGTVTVISGGAGYQSPPLVNTSDGWFYGATFGHTGTVAVAVTGTPHALTHIGSGFTGSSIGMAQWSNERILIIDPAKGMFDWNGVTLVPPSSVFSIVVTQGGAYTSAGAPTISIAGGGGAGAAATPIFGANGVQAIAAGGAGYVVGDVLTYVGGTFTRPAQVKVTTVGAGAVTAVSVLDPGAYSVMPANPVAVTNGLSVGSGATFTASFAVLAATITAPGHDYASAPTATFSVGAAKATVNIMAAPTNPVLIAVYAQRVWIATADRKLWNSAAGAYNDFLSVSSGVKLLQDPTLNSGVTTLFAANSYLYYTGVNSVNVISDVTVNANGNTTFSDTNLTSSTGTSFTQSLVPYLRSTLFFCNDGIYSLYGATPAKISEPMDGVFKGIDFHGLVSGGVFTLQQTLCAAFMVLYNTTGQPSNSANSRQLMMVYFKTKHGEKWFVANQDGAGRIITVAGAPAVDPTYSRNLYGTDGTTLYRLFDDATNVPSWKVETSYWDMGDVGRDKEVNALGFEQSGNAGGIVSVSLDMVQKEPPYTSSSDFTVDLENAVPWLNTQGNPIPWLNTQGNPIPWLTSGYMLDMEDVQENPAFGKYVGVTLTSNNVQGSITSILLRYSFRGDW